MSVMAVPPPAPPPPSPWLFPTPGPDGFAAGDLAALPDDGSRYELVDGTLVVSRPGGLTDADLERVVDGGSNRYELIDGMLHVSPCPVPRRQVVLGELFVRLHAGCRR